MLRRSHTYTTNLASLRRRNGSKARSYTATTVVLHRHRPPSQVRKPSLQGREGAAPPSAAAKTGPIPPRVPLESSAGADLRKLDSNGTVTVRACVCSVRSASCGCGCVLLHYRACILCVRMCCGHPCVHARTCGCTQCTHKRALAVPCTHARRHAPGQVLSGTFGTHSPSQSTPGGESSSSRVRRWLLARSTGFSILVLHMVTWCMRLSRGGCALCSVARAAVTTAERCGCRGGAVLYRSSGSSRLEHRRLFSTKPRATASCNAHACSAGLVRRQSLHAVRTFPISSDPCTDVGCEFALVHVASCFSALTTRAATLGCSTCVSSRLRTSLQYSAQPAIGHTHAHACHCLLGGMCPTARTDDRALALVLCNAWRES
jgi:hypothetical protein